MNKSGPYSLKPVCLKFISNKRVFEKSKFEYSISEVVYHTDLIWITTVVPTKSDSDVILYLQLQSKTLACTLHLSIRGSIDHLCINPIQRLGLIHK